MLGTTYCQVFNRRYSELREEGMRRGAARTQDRGSDPLSQRRAMQSKPLFIDEGNRRSRSQQNCGRVESAVADRALISACLADVALAGRRFFYLRPHGKKIIRCRYDGE